MEGVFAGLRPGEEFKLCATPDEALLRKLSYLATQDTDSVMTGNARSRAPAASRKPDGSKAQDTDALIEMARLADPAYQALSARINTKLDRMDEASVIALQQIEHELTELRRQREQMLEQAYRDEQGRAIFMTENETAAYYEDGSRVADEEFAGLKLQLQDGPSWDRIQSFSRREEELNDERQRIHEHDAEREELREDLAEVKISAEEAEYRSQEIEETMPERLRVAYSDLTGNAHDSAPVREAALSSEEAALLNARSTTPASPDSDEGTPVNGTTPASPPTPG